MSFMPPFVSRMVIVSVVEVVTFAVGVCVTATAAFAENKSEIDAGQIKLEKELY